MNPTNNTPGRSKLQLSRETLRDLDVHEAREVVGGTMVLKMNYTAMCGGGETTTCAAQRYSYQTCMTTM